MRSGTPVRRTLLAAVAGLGSLALATPAWATSSVPLNQSNETAADFQQECGDERFEGKPADHDGWHFVLPGKNSGDFTSLTLTFKNTAGSTVSVNVPDAGDSYPDYFYKAGDQVKHAYVFTPAGWTLVTGTATISGTGKFFNLSHTCAGTGTPGPGPSGSPSPGPSGKPSSSPSNAPEQPGGGGGDGDGSLPVTGAAAGGIALGGLALIGGGTALMVIRRRRRIDFVS